MTTPPKPPDSDNGADATPAPAEVIDHLQAMAAACRSAAAAVMAEDCMEGVRTSPAFDAHRARIAELEASPVAVAIRESLEYHRAKEREGLRAALDAGIGSLTPAERKWIAEDPARREDLSRRLLAAHADLLPDAAAGSDRPVEGESLEALRVRIAEQAEAHSAHVREAREALAAKVDALAASPTPEGRLLLAAVRRLWEEALLRWDAERDAPPSPWPREAASREAENVRAGRLPSFKETEHLFSDSAGRRAEVEALYLWPSVRDAWRREVWERARLPALFPIPGAIVTGGGNLAALFGGRHDLATVASVVRLSPGGKIKALRLESGRKQLDLLSDDFLQLAQPTEEEIVRAFGRVLGNREWRMLLACFASAYADSQLPDMAGRVGAFWYTPSRFAALHGLARESGRKGGIERYDRAGAKRLDESLHNLGQVRGELTVKIDRKELRLGFEDLVRYDGASVTITGPRKRGRPKALLYRVNHNLWGLAERWFVPIPLEVLPAPVDPSTGNQVRQDTWADAVKLYTLLAAHARVNARMGGQEDALPWTRKVEGLFRDANLATDRIPVRQVRTKGLSLLDLLCRTGFLVSELEGEGEDARVRYDLPTIRPTLSRIPSRRGGGRLPALAGKEK